MSEPRGIRLVHDTQRGGMLLVEHPSLKYKGGPYLCPTCRFAHRNKIYHLMLDGEGACIVSQGVLKGLIASGMPGLTVANPVKNPPTQEMNLNANIVPTVVEHKLGAKFPFKRLSVARNKLLHRKDGRWQTS